MEVTNLRLEKLSFLSLRTSIDFHKKLSITYFLKEFSTMEILSKQIRPTADFYKKWGFTSHALILIL